MAERVERKGPWKICKKYAYFIIRFIIRPILDDGGKLSEHPNWVADARKLAQIDHIDHQYTGFDIGGGRAANPKGKRS